MGEIKDEFSYTNLFPCKDRTLRTEDDMNRLQTQLTALLSSVA